MVILHTYFGSTWTTFSPMKKYYFQKPLFAKLKIFRMKSVSITNIFTRQAIAKNPFFLHSNNTGDTPFRVWLDLEIFLTRWERTIFKIPYSRNSKTFVWNPYELVTFLLDKLWQKFILSYVRTTQWILHAEFVLVWTSSWPDQKDLF